MAVTGQTCSRRCLNLAAFDRGLRWQDERRRPAVSSRGTPGGAAGLRDGFDSESGHHQLSFTLVKSDHFR